MLCSIGAHLSWPVCADACDPIAGILTCWCKISLKYHIKCSRLMYIIYAMYLFQGCCVLKAATVTAAFLPPISFHFICKCCSSVVSNHSNLWSRPPSNFVTDTCSSCGSRSASSIRDYTWWGRLRLKPGCWIVGSVTTVQLIRKANDQFCLHYAVISDRTKRIVWSLLTFN